MITEPFITNITGEYSGWFQVGNEPEEFEDMIGLVKISLDDSDPSIVVIESIEIGTWKGSINQENIILGTIQGDNIKFKLTISETEIRNKYYTVIEGAVLNEKLEPDFKIYLRKEEAHR